MSHPALPDSFEWMQTPRGLVLKCRPLDAIAPHVFTTRGGPISDAFTANQVHGRAVVTVRRGGRLPESRPDADALVSDDPAVTIAVRAADCVPLLLADKTTGAVSAVHAGWRGTAAGVAGAAIETLTRELGATPANMVAAIGPSIGPCCYEVGSELVDAFAAAGHARHLVDRWFSQRGEKLFLDVPGANRDQLILAGVPADQIFLSGLCTAEHLDLLTSYRVEKEKATRIAGVIRASGLCLLTFNL